MLGKRSRNDNIYREMIDITWEMNDISSELIDIFREMIDIRREMNDIIQKPPRQAVKLQKLAFEGALIRTNA